MTVDFDTRATHDLGVGTQPVWNPAPYDTRLAYVDGLGRVAVAFGSGVWPARELTSLPSTSPVWRPNTADVVFVASTVLTGLPEGRYGHPVRSDLYSASADDATVGAVRITGPFDPLDDSGPLPTSPVFSVPGNSLLFHASGQVWQANTDGTCAYPIVALAHVEEGPVLATRLGRQRNPGCVDLYAHVKAAAPFALGQPGTVEITIENHGNATARSVDVHLEPSTSTVVFGCGSDTYQCPVGDMPPGSSQTVAVQFEGTTAGLVGLHYSISSTPDDITPGGCDR